MTEVVQGLSTVKRDLVETFSVNFAPSGLLKNHWNF